MNSYRLEPNLSFPILPDRYDQPLRAAVTFVQEHYQPIGIIASGSIIRGNPGPTSDFDMYVIHDQPFRQRVQRRFHGVPAEIFVNNPAAVRSYFADECKAGRPCTAHMLTTGFVILDRDPVIATLCQEAQEWLAKRPDLSAAQLVWKRYGVVDLLDNARDLIDSDPANASLFLHEAVRIMVDYTFLAANQNLPRFKEIIAVLEQEQPLIGELVRSYYESSNHKQRFAFAEQIAEHSVGVTEFFEWETKQETYPN